MARAYISLDIVTVFLKEVQVPSVIPWQLLTNGTKTFPGFAFLDDFHVIEVASY